MENEADNSPQLEGEQAPSRPEVVEAFREIEQPGRRQLLRHSALCEDGACQTAGCRQSTRKVAKHLRSCVVGIQCGCHPCAHYYALCFRHSFTCRTHNCWIWFCETVKANSRSEDPPKHLCQG